MRVFMGCEDAMYEGPVRRAAGEGMGRSEIKQ